MHFILATIGLIAFLALLFVPVIVALHVSKPVKQVDEPFELLRIEAAEKQGEIYCTVKQGDQQWIIHGRHQYNHWYSWREASTGYVPEFRVEEFLHAQMALRLMSPQSNVIDTQPGKPNELPAYDKRSN